MDELFQAIDKNVASLKNSVMPIKDKLAMVVDTVAQLSQVVRVIADEIGDEKKTG